jgi:polyprenyl-phospho-N-acetylgalactosaminyl synthase
MDQVTSTLPQTVRENLFLVIAAYNEEGLIDQVVQSLLPEYPNIVVVDDGSTDRTGAIADKSGARVLRHVINRGQGAALQTGIEYALAAGAGYVVTFDADGQHSAEAIPELLRPILAGKAEISLGSRFLEHSDSVPWTRRLLLRLAVVYTRMVSGVRLSDTHNGLRAFSRRAASMLNIRLDRMAHANEIIDQVRGSGLTYTEVPVRVEYTEYSRLKGQRLSAAPRVVLEYLLGRLLS